ncbi:hypothetical protein PG994_006745 [Apiospora phragmitis]|uniref:SUZ domain-containing protein n=1 Tax=Apiospora phragmitis TaxID=2905665 RepID=A0ABR1VJM7_9PEZI
MVKKSSVPNAWEDDDWESQADKEAQEPAAQAPPAPLTKKERLAQHAELNRKIWETADTPGNGAPLQYLAATPTPPLAQPFKAPMTVLARKPMIAKRDPVTGLSSLTMADDDDDDDEANKKPPETPEEIRARQQREREEKQKRYDEMRAKIFGESSSSSPAGPGAGRGGSGRSSGTSTPDNVTPPTQRSGGERRGRGRGRGGYRGGRGGGGGGGDGGNNDRFTDRGGERSEYQRPISQSGGGGGVNSELYDPSYSPKPTSTFDRRGNTGGGAPLSGRSTPRDDDQVIRAPRGPPTSSSDNGGRGGFGFARRGAKEG